MSLPPSTIYAAAVSLTIVAVAAIVMILVLMGKLKPSGKIGPLFLLILIASSSSLILLRQRVDAVETGTYVVSWGIPYTCVRLSGDGCFGLDPSMSMDTIYAGALTLNFTLGVIFPIRSQGSLIPFTLRQIPTTVYLMHSLDHLFVGVHLRGIGLSPYSNASIQFVDHFGLLLDVDNDGRLTTPESGFQSSANFDCIPWNPCKFPGSHSPYDAEGDFNLAYTGSESTPFGGGWNLSPDNCLQKSSPASGGEFNEDTGDLYILLVTWLRDGNPCANGLQIQPGERWVMGFLLEAGFYGWYGGYQNFMATWPRSPENVSMDDSSWWPRLAIDLTNPPRAFSSPSS